MNKAAFKKAFGASLGSGFVHKGQSWTKESVDAIVLLGLQKSDFEVKYYINFGIWLKCLGVGTFSDNNSHIQARLTSLFIDHSLIIDKACALISDDDDFAAFIRFMSNDVVPFCDDCLRLDKLRLMFAEGKFRKALIIKLAKDTLAAP